MLPHPVLASEDDADYVTRTILNLPKLMMRLFECLDAVYTRADSGESNALASLLYFTIRHHLKILSSVPEDSFRIVIDTSNGADGSSSTGGVDKDLPRLLSSLHRLFVDDMMKVGPKALSWKKKCTGLATECADHMRQASVKFPRRNRFHRQVISPSKTMYGLLLLFFFLSVLLSVLIMIVIPTVAPPGKVGLFLGIPAVLLLLCCSVAVVFYYIKATLALQSLYRQIFQDGMIYGAGRMASRATVGNGMTPTEMTAMMMWSDGAGGAGGPGGPGGPGVAMRRGGANEMLDATGALVGGGGAGGPGGGGGGGGVGGAAAAGGGAGGPGGGGLSDKTKKGYYTIPYGGDIGYIDGRQLDAQVVMIAYDQNFHITRWNNAAEVLTGFLEDGCVGKPLTELVQSPSGNSIIEEIQRARKNKPIKIKLCSLATPPNILHTIVTPIVNPHHETVGHILICANSTDNLRHYRTYLHHYVGIQATEALGRLSKRPTLSREDNARILSLRNFMENCLPSHIDELAREMTTEWEWTNADQLLSRAFGESLAQHTRVVDPLFPPTICVSPLASKALGLSVSQRGPSMLNLNVVNLAGKVYALTISITAKHRHSKGETLEEYAKVEESMAKLLSGAAGSFTPIDDRILLTFPCQVAPIIDDVEEDQEDAEGLQLAAQGRSIINCTVNVVTMISNMVDQYNLSLGLLKTLFVSLASVRDRSDLEQRLTAQPCEVDVVICDGEFLSSCRDLLMSKTHSAIIIPFLSAETPINSNLFHYVIRLPVVGKAVQEVMVEVGREVSARKNAISAQEEREHILTLRQDSPWTKGKMLGRGSQGAVYEATSDLTGGKMAVKIFYFNSANSENSINRLLNEVKIMCSLNHPNIVHYFHSERTENGVHLFMELCDGSLTDVMVRRLAKPDHLGVQQIIRQVLTAITYLHGRGIAHRDVKPQNILLKGDTIKLTDFGTAREGSATKEVGGTLRYMAPEVYRGQAHSLPCDLWSTGCLVCELLGCPPAFMDDAVLLADMKSAIPYLKNLPDNPALHDFLYKCFEMEPERRASSRDLLAHPLLRLDTPCSDVEAHSVFNAPAKAEIDATFSICSQ